MKKRGTISVTIRTSIMWQRHTEVFDSTFPLKFSCAPTAKAYLALKTDGAGVNGLMLAGSSSPFRGETHKVGLKADEKM